MQVNTRLVNISLLVISSTLLGIWAVKDTIALRNILLALGCFLSFFYIHQNWHGSLSKLRIVNYLPILMILAMFLWVVGHYVFLSTNAHLQWQELKSTWLRSFMAVILGFGTGLVIHQMRYMLPALWAGILVSFAYLIYQYIPKAQQLNSLFATDWSPGYYIYIGKINGVLMGSILVAALIGVWIDRFKASEFKLNLWLSFYCFLGICLTLYSYVFIFDTRNGLGLAFILMSCWIFVGVIWGILRLIKEKSFSNIKILLAPVLIIVIGMGWFGSQQMQRNSGWITMFEDAAIAAQTERYINWQDTDKFGLPKNEQGRSVALNTYQRVSWALVGIRLIPTQPVGGGVLAESFRRSLKQSFPEANPISTHSAWIEISLAFGLPGLIFTVGTIFAILILTIRSRDKSFSGTIYTICFTLLFLYSIGELSTQHGIEVLFYMMAFLSALQMPISLYHVKLVQTQ
jgi:hypothetical protein